MHCFFDGFLGLASSILGAIWEPNCMEKPPRKEKGDFVKMRVSCRRELNFDDFSRKGLRSRVLCFRSAEGLGVWGTVPPLAGPANLLKAGLR